MLGGPGVEESVTRVSWAYDATANDRAALRVETPRRRGSLSGPAGEGLGRLVAGFSAADTPFAAARVATVRQRKARVCCGPCRTACAERVS